MSEKTGAADIKQSVTKVDAFQKTQKILEHLGKVLHNIDLLKDAIKSSKQVIDIAKANLSRAKDEKSLLRIQNAEQTITDENRKLDGHIQELDRHELLAKDDIKGTEDNLSTLEETDKKELRKFYDRDRLRNILFIKIEERVVCIDDLIIEINKDPERIQEKTYKKALSELKAIDFIRDSIIKIKNMGTYAVQIYGERKELSEEIKRGCENAEEMEKKTILNLKVNISVLNEENRKKLREGENGDIFKEIEKTLECVS